MQIQQASFKPGDDVAAALAPLSAIAPQLVLVFAAPQFFSGSGAAEQLAAQLHATFPAAQLIGCSTAGEINGACVQENSAVVTAVHFQHARVLAAATELTGMEASYAAGQRVGKALAQPDLRAVLVFAPGVAVNGSALVAGMTAALGSSLPIMGGLAGDNGAFQQTWTIGKDGISPRAVVAVGLAGAQLQIGHGFFGGWRAFGPARCVTRCEGNLLYELDNEPALEVYKRYLGDYARDLPASGLLFPFEMLGDDLSEVGLIRTILGIDEANGSLLLAGAIHQGGFLRLMQASTDALIDGAEVAAEKTVEMQQPATPHLALLVSCVGRKLVMGDRVEEEIEAVTARLGKQAHATGFYSYGEITPFAPGVACEVHNQTMTITTISESA
jgi:hypothetical protein